MEANERGLQEYDFTVEAPVQVWVFCRKCRCRLQVRMVPRPSLDFACLCGAHAPLAGFDVFDDEDRAREVAEQFELAYQATKEALSPIIPMHQTSMLSAELVASLKAGMEASGSGEISAMGEHEPPPNETEDAYQARLAELMADVQAAGTDLLARHDALNAVARFGFERRHLRHAARTVCIRACEADLSKIHELIQAVRATRSTNRRLKLPAFRQLVDIFKETGDVRRAREVAMMAKSVGMPGFD